MILKIGKSLKTGNEYVALGYKRYGLFIPLTYDKRNIYDFLDSIGFKLPTLPGEYTVKF